MKYLKSLLSESKNFVLLAAFLLVLGALFGYVYHEAFIGVIEQALAQLEEITDRIAENDTPQFVSSLIFQNNVQAALMMIGLGTIFFLAPMISMFVNGLAVGFILKVSATGGISPGGLFLYGILPHGILELPAIILAGGIGTFLGWKLLTWVIRRIGNLFKSAEQKQAEAFRSDTFPVLLDRLKGLGILIVLLVVVLFAAAYIEGYITPQLLERFMEQA